MILVTGGTGSVGQALVAELKQQSTPFQVMSRDLERAKAKLGAGIDVMQGDLGDPRTLAKALQGVDAVFLLAAPGPTVPAHDLAMVAAAKKAGIRKIVKLSSYGANNTTLHSSKWHRTGEEEVERSGMAFVLLRPGAFSTNALAWAPAIRAGQPIRLATGEGRHGVVDIRDLAQVAARVLISNDFDGQALTLTGPEALTAGEQVAAIGRALGRDLPVAAITPEEMGAGLRAMGMPEAYVEAVIQGQRFMRDNGASALTDSVQKVLGRPPRLFVDWARDHVAAFR